MSTARPDFRRLVDGASLRAFTLTIPDQLLARADALIQRHGWAEDWGADALLVLFYHGLAALELERADAGIDTNNLAALAQAMERLRVQWMGLDGRRAVLRFHLFQLMKSNQILTMRETALRIDNRGLRIRLERFARDREELERRLRGRTPAASACGASPTASTASVTPAWLPHLIEHLRTWLRRQLTGGGARADRDTSSSP